jgi:hypothetical protein
MGLLGEVAPNVERAFYGYDEWEVEAFASRWGGLHTEVFVRVLAEGGGDDKVFAIFAIGYLNEAWAQQQMWSFVESPVRKERWASAYCLGVQHNEDALPYLRRILVDALDPTEEMSLEEESWYAVQHDYVAKLLTSWGVATVVPDLRQAFLAAHAFQEAKPHANSYLFVYQDTLTYALGQFGAVGALTGIELPSFQRRVAMVYMALGILRIQDRYKVGDYVAIMISDKKLQAEVAEVLGQHFGLSESERQDMVSTFWHDAQERVPEPAWWAEVDMDEILKETEDD